MKLAVFSDSHDNIPVFEKALEQSAAADVFIHCGDLCSPFMVDRLGRFSGGKPVHVVWGNNDGDVRLMILVAAKYGNIEFHGQLAQLELDGLRVGVNHYPEIARPLAESGRYDLVCYGHDHTGHSSRVNECILLNPGEMLGMKAAPTFALFDTATRQAEFVEVA